MITAYVTANELKDVVRPRTEPSSVPVRARLETGRTSESQSAHGAGNDATTETKLCAQLRSLQYRFSPVLNQRTCRHPKEEETNWFNQHSSTDWKELAYFAIEIPDFVVRELKFRLMTANSPNSRTNQKRIRNTLKTICNTGLKPYSTKIKTSIKQQYSFYSDELEK